MLACWQQHCNGNNDAKRVTLNFSFRLWKFHQTFQFHSSTTVHSTEHTSTYYKIDVTHTQCVVRSTNLVGRMRCYYHLLIYEWMMRILDKGVLLQLSFAESGWNSFRKMPIEIITNAVFRSSKFQFNVSHTHILCNFNFINCISVKVELLYLTMHVKMNDEMRKPHTHSRNLFKSHKKYWWFHK